MLYFCDHINQDYAQYLFYDKVYVSLIRQN